MHTHLDTTITSAPTAPARESATHEPTAGRMRLVLAALLAGVAILSINAVRSGDGASTASPDSAAAPSAPLLGVEKQAFIARSGATAAGVWAVSTWGLRRVDGR